MPLSSEASRRRILLPTALALILQGSGCAGGRLATQRNPAPIASAAATPRPSPQGPDREAPEKEAVPRSLEGDRVVQSDGAKVRPPDSRATQLRKKVKRSAIMTREGSKEVVKVAGRVACVSIAVTAIVAIWYLTHAA